MITEDYVSFEIAKLLKEKRFDEPCHALYHDGDDKIFFGLDVDSYHNSTLNVECYACPTLQTIMKWLREVYNICIELHFHPNKKDWGWYFTLLVIDNIKKCFRGYGPYETYSSYEEAAEAAIKYCLEKLL